MFNSLDTHYSMTVMTIISTNTLRKRDEVKEYIMGKTIKSGKSLLKLGGFLVGTVPGSIRLADDGMRKVAPDFMDAVDSSTVGSLLLGDSAAHDHVIDKTVNMFEGQSVSLTSDEIKACEQQAKDFADQSGVDYDVALVGLKASAIEQKRKDASK